MLDRAQYGRTAILGTEPAIRPAIWPELPEIAPPSHEAAAEPSDAHASRICLYRSGGKRTRQATIDWCPARQYRSRLRSLAMQFRLAEEVQRSLLPRTFPNLAEVGFSVAYQPFDHMSGDFYNVFRLDREHVGFLVGDVMGHGPGAALLSVYALHTLQTKHIEGSRYEILPPAETVERLSRTLIEANLPGQPFLTMVYGVLDVVQRRLTYCSGGHPAPVLLHNGQAPRWLESNAPLLGVFDGQFRQDEVELAPGDRVMLYSDGVAEATWGGRGHGLDGLTNWLSSVEDPSQVQAELDAAMASAEFDRGPGDDLTAMVVAMLG